MDTPSQPWVQRLLAASPVPPWSLALITAAVLALPLAAAALVDSAGVPGGGHTLWRLAMAPALIGFILAVHPLQQRRWRDAVAALRPLHRRPEVLDEALLPSRPGEAVAALLGALLAFWISQSMASAGWLYGYSLVTQTAMFVLLALSIHEGLRRTRHLKRVVAAGLALDLFDRQLLTPLARFGQGVSLTFVGGVCLSLLFQSGASLYSLQSLVTYSILVAVALGLFFSSVWSIHAALVAAQARELAAIRAEWNRARDAWRQHHADAHARADLAETQQLYQPLVTFGAYERLVLEASTWPFNPKIVKELAAAGVAPIVIYAIKVAIGFSGRL